MPGDGKTNPGAKRMAATMHVDVDPKLLRWARERSGLDAGELTHRFPRLADWEMESARPTLKQLERFAPCLRALQ
jgi:hypothetical protein